MEQNLEKILFKLDLNDWHGYPIESMWGKALLNPNNKESKFNPESVVFQLMNSPFYVKGVSYLDIVYVDYDPKNKLYYFKDIMEYSGHSTYRLLTNSNDNDFTEYWQKLEFLGCTYESGKNGQNFLYTVDVPPTSNILEIKRIIEEGNRNKIWMAELGHVKD